MKYVATTARLLSVGAFALVVASCGGSQSASPISPTPLVPRPTFTLSGLVFAATPTGLVPVEGVVVEEANLRQRATTDANGAYSISGLYAMSNVVTASKIGYETDSRTLTISGDTRLDLRVVRRATYTLSGVISELTATGRAAVEGVRVEALICHTDAYGCPINSVPTTITDRNGFYSVSGLYEGTNYLWAIKDGYQPGPVPNCEGSCWTVEVNSDTRFDIQLVRR